WLKAEIAACGKDPSRRATLPTLSQWRQDGDLASLRDTEALAKLPADEQKAFARLWSDVKAALPADELVEDVLRELQARNPRYNGKLTPMIARDAVIGLNFDINPTVSDLTDLTPLKGMPLKSLGIMHTGVTDLTPLKGMPLEQLMAWGWRGSDLTPLKGMP